MIFIFTFREQYYVRSVVHYAECAVAEIKMIIIWTHFYQFFLIIRLFHIFVFFAKTTAKTKNDKQFENS